MSEKPKSSSSFAALYDLDKAKKAKIKDQDRKDPAPTLTPTLEEKAPPVAPTKEQDLTPTDWRPQINIDAHKTEAGANYRDRHLPGKVRVSVRYGEGIHSEMIHFCAKAGLTLQDFHELAVVFFMENFGKVDAHNSTVGVNYVGATAPARVGAKTPTIDRQAPHDDLKIFRTHEDIIMLFERITGRRWKPADDRAAAAFNALDHRLIEIGMIQTAIQARGRRINSFAYFIPEIQVVIDANFDRSNIDHYLRRRREMLEKWLAERGR